MTGLLLKEARLDRFGSAGCSLIFVGLGDESGFFNASEAFVILDLNSFSTGADVGDRGGLSVTLIGDDGIRYYGSHFRKIAPGIEPGVRVEAGTLLAYIGATGSARGTAPHVHFGISWPTPVEANVWWVRRGAVYPWKYLDAWKIGKDRSPVKEVNAKKLSVGEIPPLPKK